MNDACVWLRGISIDTRQVNPCTNPTESNASGFPVSGRAFAEDEPKDERWPEKSEETQGRLVKPGIMCLVFVSWNEATS